MKLTTTTTKITGTNDTMWRNHVDPKLALPLPTFANF